MALVVLGFGVLGCTPKRGGVFDTEVNDYHDRHLGLSRDDYRNLDDPDAPEGETPPGKRARNNPNDTRPRGEHGRDGSDRGGPDTGGSDMGGLGNGENAPDIKTSIVTKAPPIPTLSQILATPQPPKIGESRLVSIAVTDDVPLKDVLIELSRLADVDIELDAGITGGIAFTATDRPFNEVIARIADLAGLRYSMKSGVLRVERDQPYIRNYTLDFLNVVRNSQSTVTINTSVLSSSGGGSSGGSSGGGGGGSSGGSGGGSGLNSGSNTSVSSKNDNDLWSSMETGIKEILSYAPSSRTAKLASTVDEATDPTVGAAAPGSTPSTAPGGTPGGALPPGSPLNAAAGAGTPNAATGLVTAGTPAAGAAGAGGTANPGVGPGSGRGAQDTFYILNRQAGILTVSANDKQHTLIETFIDRMRNSASAQVLIEAKIVEVSLSDRFQSGIQWGVINNKLGFSLGDATLAGTNKGVAGVIKFGESESASGADIDNLLTLLDEFGTTRTLSSPRLHAINNQQAVLTFARNEVYFDLKIERERNTVSAGGVNDFLTVDSEAKTVPIGLILSMLPSINLETNEVTLNVRPTLSRIASQVADPAVAYLASTTAGGIGGLQNLIPVVEVRELDSILKLKSGDVMVIGGLMEQAAINKENGVPFISDVPYLGNLFKNNDKMDRTSELVILVRATIVDSNGNMHESDRKLLDKFTRDPRPF